MSRSIHLCIVVTCALMATTAYAQQHFLDGAYGNADGCAYAKSGESTGSEDFFLLTNEAITTATASCEFKGKAKTTKSGFSIDTQCETEGETGDKENVALNKTPKGYTIDFKDGTHWGPLAKCK